MSLFKRYGLLPFIYVGQYNDWQLKGYYNSIKPSLKNVPNDRLVSFRTPPILGSYTVPATMLIRHISILDNEVSVINSSTVTSALVKVDITIEGVAYSYYYRQQAALASALTAGCMYDIFIEDEGGNQFVSEPFVTVDTLEVFETKPIFKRSGFLPVYKSTESHDWQLDGYFKNWVRALRFVSKSSLVGFRTPLIYGTYTVPATMKIRQLRIVDSTVVMVTEETITSDLVKELITFNGVAYTYYYRNETALVTELTEGCIYDIYITDGTNIFISDIFLAIDDIASDFVISTESGLIITTEDDEYIKP